MDIAANELKKFYFSQTDRLYKNETIRKNIIELKNLYRYRDLKGNDKEIFRKILSIHIEEAELTVSLLKDIENLSSKSLLEVGGGIGLTYGFLKKEKIDIISIEPGEPGFASFYQIGKEILKTLKIDYSGWRSLYAEECNELKKSFDIIFSNNVLEHIPNLENAIVRLKKVLKEDGAMYHGCPNYFIPYEPHFGMVLIPFFPKSTGFIAPSLRKTRLWKNLNFMTAHKIKKICKKHGMDVKFRPRMMFDTLKRLEIDSQFRARQMNLWKFYLFLKKTGILYLLKIVPSEMGTPMQFRITKKSS